MAVLEKLKTKGGYVLAIVIGVALLAFILGDLLDPSKSLFTVQNLDVAEVKGKTISYPDLSDKIQEVTSIYQMQTGQQSMDEATQQSIHTQAYNTLVNEIIMNDEYDALGLKVTSDELFDVIQGPTPHSIILSLFTDQETGTFSRTNLLYFLKNKNNDATGQQQAYWAFIENEIYNEQLANKYIALIQQGLYIPSFVIDNDVAENENAVNIAYVVKPYSALPDSLAKATDADINAYYQKHIKQFEQKTSRDINYVLFNVVPSAEDDQQALAWVEKNKADFASTENAAQFLALNSDDAYEDINYSQADLSTFTDTLFNAEIVTMVGPYTENSAYKLAKLVAINMVPDSICARHILIQPTANTEAAIAVAEKLTDSLMVLIQGGSDFAELAQTYSTDKVSGAQGGDLGWFGETTMVKEFTDGAFALQKGETGIVESSYGFHIVQVTDRSAETKKVKIAVLTRNIVPSSQTYQRIYSEASTFAGQNTTSAAFAASASEGQLSILSANSIDENDQQIAGISAREMVRWIYNAQVGDVSPCITLSDAYMVATLTATHEEGTMPLQDVKSVLSILVTRENKGKVLSDQIAASISGATSISDVASRLQLAADTASNISFATYSIPGLGIEPKLVGLASQMKEGQLSAPIAGANGVYVIQVIGTSKNSSEDRNISEARLSRTIQSRVESETLGALQDLAEIKDMRSNFF